jgi:diguanylate cyclase (GGDEF)-like protein/PAS domain S-box-containing protein
VLIYIAGKLLGGHMFKGVDEKLSDFTVLEALTCIVVVYDRLKGVIFLNSEAERFFNVCEGEICSMENIHESRLPELFTSDDFSVNSVAKISVTDSTGLNRWFNITKVYLDENEGKILSVGVDITSQVLAGDKVAREHRLLQSIMTNSPVGIMLLDCDLRVMFANRAAVEMIGYRVGHDGTDINSCFSGKLIDNKCVLKPAYECPFDRLKEEGRAFFNELYCVDRNGLRGYVNVNASPVRDSMGNVESIVCTLENHTEITQTRKLLEESENKYRNLADFSPNGILLHKDFIVKYINKAGADIMGFDSPEDMVGANLLDYMGPSEKDTAVENIKCINETGRPLIGYERESLRKDGRRIFLKISSQSFESRDGKMIQCVFRDVTEERLQNQEIKKLFLVVEQSPVSVVITGVDGTIEYVNKSFSEITGYSLEESVGRNINILKSGVHPQEYYRQLWETILSGNVWKGEICSRKKNGELVWELASISPVKCDKGDLMFYVAVKENITEKKEREEQIRHLALHDLLTGLPNRFLMRDRLESAIARAERTGELSAVLFIDLDKFKVINDTYGHKAGDYVLKETSQRLLNTVRIVDTVCRIGGDEFLVILNNVVSKESVVEVAERIIAAIGEPYIYEGKKCSLGVSIGIALCPENGKKVDELINNADAAMYTVKNEGRNNYAFFRDLPK